MNRRQFCRSLAMVPAAVVAINVGVPEAARVINTGNVKLQFPKLRPAYGAGLREHPYSVTLRIPRDAMIKQFTLENSNETG